MLKRVLRSTVAEACNFAGVVKRAEDRLRGSLTILCYHRILPPKNKEAYFSPDLVVTPGAFAAHCAALDAHYDVHALAKAFDMLRKGEMGNRPLAAITFDDGYRDNFKYAAPILEARGLRATFFVVAGLVGAQEAPWYDILSRAVVTLSAAGRLESSLDEVALCSGLLAGMGRNPNSVVQAAKLLAPDARASVVARLAKLAGGDRLDPDLDTIMTWQELKFLQSAGHEIASHTVSHEILPSLGEEALMHELVESKRILERGLGASVQGFCYPNGDVDEETLGAVKLADYSYACTMRKGTNHDGGSPFELRRWFICERRLLGAWGKPSSSLIRLELTGLADHFFQRNRP